MALGLGLLRLSPQSFWAMTPRELERALSVLSQGKGPSPGRNELAALMREFPDAGTEHLAGEQVRPSRLAHSILRQAQNSGPRTSG
ncbi:hypothetical protein BFN67_19630 [Pseudaminobacter manganicus]|uniref:Phage tail assembly chaperone n=2 Tax=Manganibacter manganicus TaxID=1873176 RepID=A0A1V8RPX5_9HYPH|nr:hypothetical protein BFN67_19630 [Pseudaminobacter manganicus]